MAAGDESHLLVLIKAFAARSLGCAGTWRLPSTRKVLTANLEMLERVTSLLNDQVTAPRARRQPAAAAPEHLHRSVGQLRITTGFGS